MLGIVIQVQVNGQIIIMEGYYYPRDPYGIAGYTFTGWSGSPIYSTSTGNRYYTANWKLIYYNVGYNYNGGNDPGNRTSYTINSPFWVTNPSKTGYAFTGWTGSNGGTPQTSVYVSGTGNKSYTANWDVINYNHDMLSVISSKMIRLKYESIFE